VFFLTKRFNYTFFDQPKTKLEDLAIVKTSRPTGIDKIINVTGKRENAGKS
jgi:hypothetical protein